MNSEELEQSLRTEFESYLKGVIAEMRQEAYEFQSNIEAEFDKHRANFDAAFRAYTARFDSEHSFDQAFRGTVAEHLRLARDEGARITAEAMAEAESLMQPAPVAEAAPAPKYDGIRDAVADICSKDSQSAILKSLVHHAAEFAPRGAFFIIKNEHFVGWKVFGTDDAAAQSAVREIHFPTSADSILGASLHSMATVESSAGAYSGDSAFLDPINFESPARMYAIPLIARGRGVAVLYADQSQDGADINREALETLVRVAGLTVELAAATQLAKSEDRTMAAPDFDEVSHEPAAAPEARFGDTIREMPRTVEVVDEPVAEKPFAFSDSVSFEGGFPRESEPNHSFAMDPPPAESYSSFEMPAPDMTPVAEDVEESPFGQRLAPEPEAPAEYVEESPFGQPAIPEREPAGEYAEESPFGHQAIPEPVPAGEYVEASPFEHHATPAFEPAAATFEPTSPVFERVEAVVEEVEVQTFGLAEKTAAEMIFDSGGSIEPAATMSSPFDQAAEVYEPAPAVVSSGYSHAIEPVSQVHESMPPPRTRLSDRPVDLPIEVPEEERRIHNDARRFARLLVSEIKLYNEKKVLEGRQAHDLYDRLKEAIDRSREMYDKRIQPPVAAKFDYFHYELLNALADGDAARLGANYPGATV
ncbi:hypothetical protein BH10ACI3_BH10ACI3_19350 [soil metagenome]